VLAYLDEKGATPLKHDQAPAAAAPATSEAPSAPKADAAPTAEAAPKTEAATKATTKDSGKKKQAHIKE
jgi:hypothetical protein